VTSDVPPGKSSGTTLFHLVCQQNIGDFQQRVLFYADDMKLFLPVSGFQDCLKIQSDLNKLLEWCDRNSLLLNVGNKTITLSRGVLIHDGWDRARSGELHKRFQSHHGREHDFFGTCGRHGCKGLCNARIYQESFARVKRSLYSEVSLHVSGSSKAGIRKLCVESVLRCLC
jgi:hypothetical protein